MLCGVNDSSLHLPVYLQKFCLQKIKTFSLQNISYSVLERYVDYLWGGSRNLNRFVDQLLAGSALLALTLEAPLKNVLHDT